MKLIDSWVVKSGWTLVHSHSAGDNVNSVTAEVSLPSGTTKPSTKPIPLTSGTTTVTFVVTRKAPSKDAIFHVVVKITKGAQTKVLLDADETMPAGEPLAFYDLSVA